MPKPMGFCHPDFVGDASKTPWYLKLAIVLLFLSLWALGAWGLWV
jgi:hypothetical protein